MKDQIIIFDLEWNIGYKPYTFNYHGAEQTFRGEIIEIGAAKCDLTGKVLDTFFVKLRPQIFRKLQHHIAKVTGLTQEDLDRGEPVRKGIRRFLDWCGPDAVFAEWGLDDVPVLKQNLYLLNMDESYPSEWYDLQRVFESQHPRGEGEGMQLESVVTRLGLPTDRAFHDALADTLYTADVCRAIDLRRGLAEYPTQEQLLRESLCPPPGDYRDFKVFWGYVDKEANRNVRAIRDTPCPVCGSLLQPDEIWQKKGSNSVYTLCTCPVCAQSGVSEAANGVFLRYKMSRHDGLHWDFARCVEIPDEEKLAKWKKQREQTLARLRRRNEKAEQA